MFDEHEVAGASEPSGKTGHCRSRSGWCDAGPMHHGTSRSVGQGIPTSCRRHEADASWTDDIEIGVPSPSTRGWVKILTQTRTTATAKTT